MEPVIQYTTSQTVPNSQVPFRSATRGEAWTPEPYIRSYIHTYTHSTYTYTGHPRSLTQPSIRHPPSSIRHHRPLSPLSRLTPHLPLPLLEFGTSRLAASRSLIIGLLAVLPGSACINRRLVPGREAKLSTEAFGNGLTRL